MSEYTKVTGDSVRFGLIGAGGIAAKYRDVFHRHPRSRLVVAFDSKPEVAAEAVATCGGKVASSVDALLAEDIDAVVISSPNFLHAEQAEKTLRAGKHVLLQKPMTLTVEEARRITAVGHETSRCLAMYMQSIEHPLFHDLKDMAAAGVFGRVGGFNAKLANGRGQSWVGTKNFWRGSKAATGGGSFAMLAYHYINLGQWLLDAPITSVVAKSANLMNPHIEGDDIMAAVVAFGSRGLGVIESAWAVQGEQMSLHGDKGSFAYVDQQVVSLVGCKAHSGRVIDYQTPGERMTVVDIRPPEMNDLDNPLNQCTRFIEAILSGAPPDMPAAAGVQDMLALEASYRAAETGRNVDLGAAV